MEPTPTTAHLVQSADAVLVVDVLRIDAIATPTDGEREAMQAVATVKVVERLKGTGGPVEMQLGTSPGDCGEFLWPGRWLVFVRNPSDGRVLAEPGYGSWPLINAAKAMENLAEIKTIISGSHK
jgi:hypothetical protein